MKEMGNKPTSAKIRTVLKLLREIDQRSDSEEKTIIFSQFTSMLDLLEPFLRAEGIKFVRCKYDFMHFNMGALRLVLNQVLTDDGSMHAKDREVTLNKIKTSSSIRVILISFKAGSTGG